LELNEREEAEEAPAKFHEDMFCRLEAEYAKELQERKQRDFEDKKIARSKTA
jgi:hypothetical protein